MRSLPAVELVVQAARVVDIPDLRARLLHPERRRRRLPPWPPAPIRG
jgi:hypothetical protein